VRLRDGEILDDTAGAASLEAAGEKKGK
jgi:hypothetical protein